MRLRSDERRLFVALLEDIANGGPVSPDPEQSQVILEAILSGASSSTRHGYRLLAFCAEHLLRYSKRSPAQRLELIERYRTSHVYLRRALCKALVSPVVVSHYARTEVQKAAGYDAAMLGGRYRDA